MDSKEKYKFKKFIKELSSFKGRHTELVSVYIPEGYDLNKIINHLAQEQGTASNIKDKATRTHVIDSLERLIRHLRLVDKTPKNGLAVFSGNISESDNKVHIEVFSIEPPKPLKIRIYRCDQTFVLDPLIEMIESKQLYALIVMDRRDGCVGLLKGTQINEIAHLTSGVPGKTRAGGQCLTFGTLVNTPKGFAKIEEINMGDLLKSFNLRTLKLEDSKCIDCWLVNKNEIVKIKTENKEIQSSRDHLFFVKGMKTKVAEKLTEKDYLLNSNKRPIKIKKIEMTNKLTQMVDISVKNQNFIANGLIVHNSAKRFESLREIAAKEFYKRIGEIVNKEFLPMKELKGIIVGGPGQTKNEFVDGHSINNQLKEKIIGVFDLSYTGEFGLQELVEKSRDLLIKEEIMQEKEIMRRFFELLSKEPEKTAYGITEVKKALELGAVDTLLISESLEEASVDQLEELAEQTNTHLQIISVQSREGVQLKDLGGIAAILRFRIS